PPGQMRAHKKDALRRAALRHRKPARKGLRRVGPRAGFARAEQKPYGQQRSVIERSGGEDSKARPPDDNPRQYPSRSDAVAPPARRNLENPVGQRERAE